MVEGACKTPQEIEDEAFVKAAFVSSKQQQHRTSPSDRSHSTRLGSTSNRYLKTDFASRLAQLEISLDGPAPATVGTLDKTEPFMAQATTKQRAAARLYEMRMHRARGPEGFALKTMQQSQISDEETDRVSIMSVGSTPSGISEASTKICREPISKSVWRPLQVSRGLIGKKVQGAGLLHVAGSTDVDLSLRDTYQEAKKDSIDGDTQSHALRNLVRECTDAKELRRLVKLAVQIVPQGCDGTTNTTEIHKPKSSRLDTAQQIDMFETLKTLEKKADAKEREACASQTNGSERMIAQTSSRSIDKSPEVKARFERLDMLSKYATEAFESNTS